ncbi:chaperone modulator CbpM [Olivibacter sitiensis]|uniref:chaperone modulator CbpM n=1 Tax=Olivibacter sitiensis TaxID=376470 RepID=UPI000420EBB1|nr:chaperone modulator CbpM [Olivibacter sitiensis]
MATELILLREYCTRCEVDPTFVQVLEDEDMIEVTLISGERYISEDQLDMLSRFVNWHYDLDINVEGIDAMRHLMEKMQRMQERIYELEAKLQIGRF